MIKKIFLMMLMVASIGASLGLFATGYVVYDVFLGDYSHLKREKILEILSKESVVLFDDGLTQVGSLFGEEHRQYVSIHDVPDHVKNAVISSEDGSFYNHLGVDFVSTSRALMRNIMYRRREGGSTITQQTVKNLYGRPVTNLRAKYFEAINAFKMERVYSKAEILEFYLNQFHVIGNGRGVGVAARYYFSKDVQDLSLVESAFIAGSVKGPDLYNPFNKRSLKSRKKAIERGFERKNYVLGRMLEQKFISRAEHDVAVAQAVPFEQGRFQFNQLSVVDLVKRQLRRPEVLEALGVEKVEQIATLGLKITTTLNKSIQEAAKYGVKQNLSRLGIILKGFQNADPSRVRNLSRLNVREFYVGKVKGLNKTPGKEVVDVELGLAHCVVPPRGVSRVAKFLDHGVWAGLNAAKQKLFKKLGTDEAVMVSVKRELDLQQLPDWVPEELARASRALLPEPNGEEMETGATEPEMGAETAGPVSVAGAGGAEETDLGINRQVIRLYECDLEARPEVNGAAIAIDKGEILAVVGGYSQTEYNRAIYARRQPGSTFKTHTFYAALHLGWNALDPLLNVRDAYEWQRQFYYPRPDHAPASLTTTLVGAGSFSENLASVWLLAHLTKKLSPTQFWDLLANLEVATGQEEERELRQIFRDLFNVGFERDDLSEGVLRGLISEYSQDLAIVSDKQLYMVLSTLSAGGLHYEKELERLASLKDKDVSEKEKQARQSMLRNTLSRWRRLHGLYLKDVEELKAAISQGNYYFSGPALDRFRITEEGKIAYFGEEGSYEPHRISRLIAEPKYKVLGQQELLLRLEEFFSQGAFDFASDIWLDGHLPVTLAEELLSLHEERLTALETQPLRERVIWNADLRYSVGMLFTKRMVEQMGVLSKLNWVPSFPLGTNEVSLAELAMTYQTLLAGQNHTFFEDDKALNQLALLKSIEDSSGNLLWEAERQTRQVFDRFYSPSILSILRGTVTHGTGRVAGASLLLHGARSADSVSEELVKAKIRVPTFGKTGTTNDYVNATYVGFLPYPRYKGAQELSPENAVTIATYVGYDDNQRMRRRGVRIAGGTGALPAWITIAQAIIDEFQYAESFDWKKMIENEVTEVAFDIGTPSRVTVPLHSSVVLSSGLDTSLVKETDEVDLDSFNDDYAVQEDQIVTVALPGQVERGVFNPRIKIQFLPQLTEASLPAAIPEFSIDRNLEGEENLPEESSDRFASRKERGTTDELEEGGEGEGFDFLIPPPPPADEVVDE